MALIKPYLDKHPKIDESCYLAENATIVGDVEIGAQTSIWYQAVIRGDVGPVRIGERSNVQDGAILHSTKHMSSCIVGNDVVIGHGAILHGCTLQDGVLVGMGAIILDLAVVETGCIIAAGAVVPMHMRCEAGWLYAGVPAQKLKPVSQEQADNIVVIASRYLEEGERHFR